MSIVQAGKAGIWSGLDVGTRQIAQFGLAIILARLLTPADFGSAAVMIVFLSLGQAVVMTGLTTPLVQANSDQEQKSSLFWLSLGAALLIGALLLLSSPWLADAYEVANLPWLAAAIAAQLVAIALYAVPYALMVRDGEFRSIALLSMGATLVSVVVGLVLGFAGAGVWALLGHLLAFNWVCALGIWRLTRWRPWRALSLSAVRRQLGFGSWVGMSAMLDVLTTQGYALVLGRLYGLSDLGLYGRANNLQTIPVSTLGMIIGRVTLPLLAQRHHDLDRLARGLLRTNRMTMLLLVPLSVGMALTAEPLITVLFGPQWIAAAPVLTVLAWAGALTALQQTNAQVLLATGRSALHFRVELAKKLSAIALLIGGSLLGLMGLAWAQLAASMLATVIALAATKRIVGIGAGRQLSDLSGIAAAALIMGVVVMALQRGLDLVPAAELAVTIAAGALAYVAVGLGLRLRAFVEAQDLAVALWRSRRPATL